jgi:hypothetical protein
MTALYKLLAVHGQRIALGIGMLITIIYFLSVFSGLGSFSQMTKEESYGTHIFDFGLVGVIVMTVVAIAATIFFGIYQVVTHFRQSIKGLIGLGAMLVVFFVLYSTAGGEATGPVATAAEKIGGITPGVLKFIKAGTSSMLIMIVASFGILVLGEVRNMFK